MGKDKLNRLIAAIETKDHRFFHDDVSESVLDALKDLREAQKQLEEIKDVLKLLID